LHADRHSSDRFACSSRVGRQLLITVGCCAYI